MVLVLVLVLVSWYTGILVYRYICIGIGTFVYWYIGILVVVLVYWYIGILVLVLVLVMVCSASCRMGRGAQPTKSGGRVAASDPGTLETRDKAAAG